MISFTRSVFIQVLALLFLGDLGLEAKEPAKVALPEDAVAVVNGVPISKKQYDLLVGQYESMDPEHFQTMPPAEREQVLSVILDRSIMTELQVQEARRRGIDVPDELVEQEYEVFKAQFPSEEEFFAVLQKGKTSPAIWKEEVHNSMLMIKLEQAMADELVVSDEEIRQYWNQNRGAVQKDMVHARQVLVRTETGAKEVLTALKTGMPFEEVVGKYSIVQVLEKKKAGEASLDDYREKIRGFIRGQKWQSKRVSWLEDLKTHATIIHR